MDVSKIQELYDTGLIDRNEARELLQAQIAVEYPTSYIRLPKLKTEES